MANYKIIRRGEEEIERETSFFPRKEAFSFSRLKYVARRLRNFEFPDFWSNFLLEIISKKPRVDKDREQ